MKNPILLIILLLYAGIARSQATINGASNQTIITASTLPGTIGTPVASAATITPSGYVFQVNGAATISTINLPANFSSTVGGCMDIMSTGTWSTTTGGNIAAVMNAVAGIEYRACWFGTTWSIK